MAKNEEYDYLIEPKPTIKLFMDWTWELVLPNVLTAVERWEITVEEALKLLEENKNTHNEEDIEEIIYSLENETKEEVEILIS